MAHAIYIYVYIVYVYIYIVPSGYVKIAIENGPVEIVDLPINSMVIFHGYVSLPEGIC
jgi:hypothetical protein